MLACYNKNSVIAAYLVGFSVFANFYLHTYLCEVFYLNVVFVIYCIVSWHVPFQVSLNGKEHINENAVIHNTRSFLSALHSNR